LVDTLRFATAAKTVGANGERGNAFNGGGVGHEGGMENFGGGGHTWCLVKISNCDHEIRGTFFALGERSLSTWPPSRISEPRADRIFKNFFMQQHIFEKFF
jgi:hypothetical protein